MKMYNKVVFVLVLGLFSVLPVKSIEPEYASFMSLDSSFDFGTHKYEEGVRQHRFKFRNDSEEAVLINEIIPGCPCVKVKSEQKLIAPHDTSSILVQYSPDGRKRGDYQRIVYVKLNNGNNYMLLTVYGTTL